ncbi:equilibrative nucleobase transporter 1-like [Argopecten irradians]|uniref:equilibrative nucleobase transporter 1-like n=1 Tax=Argopecten irradians TaxID=31199 RepID=UPI00371C21A0
MAISSLRLAALVLFSLLEVLLFGGLQYGWFSLLFVLKQENVFRNLCLNRNNNTSVNEVSSSNGSIEASSEDCFPQDERFNLVFSIGIAVFTIIIVLFGQLYFKFGVKKIRTISTLLLVSGVLCFGFTSSDHPFLVIPGIVCVGVGGLSLLISNMQVAVLLPKASSLYVGIMNGSFDSSVVTQMAVKALYENGISHMYAYIGIAILCVIISGISTLLHPGSKGSTDSKDNVEDTKCNDNVNQNGSLNAAFNDDEKYLKSTPQKEKTNREIVCEEEPSSVMADDVTPVSVGSIICSRLYLLHLLWMSSLLLIFYYFIGSINRLLVQILDNVEQVSYFTDVMTYTMLGGIISSFVAGQVFEVQKKRFTGTMKTVVPLAVTSCLALLLSSLSFFPSPAVLYADFVVLTFFRSFVFGCNMDFIIIAFPKKYMSVLFGLDISVSGVLSLIQYALFSWADQYDDAMKHVNTVVLCLSLVSLLHPFLIYTSQKRVLQEKYLNTKPKCDSDSNTANGHASKF